MPKDLPERPDESSLLDGAVTEAERQFERMRRRVGLFLGPLVFLTFYLLPMSSLSSRAHILAAVIGWVIIWWITEPVPIPATALLGAAWRP